MPGLFILGDAAQTEGKKSLQGLIHHIKKEKGANNHEPIFVVISSKVTYIKDKDYTPRIIPVTHKLEKVENKSVLLVTKDPSTPYRIPLTEKDSPTEDVFNQIYTLNKLKLVTKSPKQLYKLFKEFDIVVADDRIHKFLPGILKAQFYEKNKKVPYMIQMARPAPPEIEVINKKKVIVKKDERCEPKYVKAQMKSIVGFPSYIAPANGTSVTIKVGFTDWTVDKLIDNIDDVLKYLIEPKFAPVGGILKSLDNVVSVHVKTSESVSLPVLQASTIENKSDDDNYSDFDF